MPAGEGAPRSSGGEGAAPAESIGSARAGRRRDGARDGATIARRRSRPRRPIDELMRAYAALVEDNKAFRQRMEREKARVIEAERAGIAQALLEAADDLERALSAVGSATSAAAKTLVEGVRLSLSALHKRIADLGAERLMVAGLPFDPQLAEAVDMVPVDRRRPGRQRGAGDAGRLPDQGPGPPPRPGPGRPVGAGLACDGEGPGRE